MKYKRDELIEKIVECFLDVDYETLKEQFKDYCRCDLSKLDNEALLAFADGRSITDEKDSIFEE